MIERVVGHPVRLVLSGEVGILDAVHPDGWCLVACVNGDPWLSRSASWLSGEVEISGATLWPVIATRPAASAQDAERRPGSAEIGG